MCVRDVLDREIARYAGRKLGGRFFRADATYANPTIYGRLEEVGDLLGHPAAHQWRSARENYASDDPNPGASVGNEGQAPLPELRE